MNYNDLMGRLHRRYEDAFLDPDIRQLILDCRNMINEYKQELELATNSAPKEEPDIIIDRLLADLKRSKKREVYRGKQLVAEINNRVNLENHQEYLLDTLQSEVSAQVWEDVIDHLGINNNPQDPDDD